MISKRCYWIICLMVLMLALAACGGSGESGASSSESGSGEAQEEAVPISLGDSEAGKEQYDMICIACHGPGGEGVEGLGKPFTTSEFLRERSDEEMLAFIKVGRPTGDPLNTTGVDMPPKGGNPALTDEQILDIIAYVRTLQE
jgi:mono/diheme cytochrome c family protein